MSVQFVCSANGMRLMVSFRNRDVDVQSLPISQTVLEIGLPSSMYKKLWTVPFWFLFLFFWCVPLWQSSWKCIFIDVKATYNNYVMVQVELQNEKLSRIENHFECHNFYIQNWPFSKTIGTAWSSPPIMQETENGLLNMTLASTHAGPTDIYCIDSTECPRLIITVKM